MLTQPSAEEIATWPAPNYVDPVTRRPLVLGIEITLLILVVLFITMRLYSRTAIVKAIGADDYFMIAATVCFCANSISISVSTTPALATGYHLWDVPPSLLQDVQPIASVAMSSHIMFVPITTFTKVSILCTYLRIFPSDRNRYFCYFMLAFTAAWAVTTFCMTLFQCSPVEAFWRATDYPNAECMSFTTVFFPTGFFNVASDFLIFLWPAKDLAKVQIPVKQRIILIATFSLGIVVCAAGISRMWYTSVFVKSYDTLWNGATLYVILSIENAVGIICGCLPACRPLLRLLPRYFTSLHESSNSSKTKKSTEVNGQSFPFQIVSRGIVKSEGYIVAYEDAGESGESSEASASSMRSKSTRADSDTPSEGSEWWICDPQTMPVRVRLAV